MLYDADPAVSSPLALHAFRHVYWNDRLRQYESSPVGGGITRLPLSSISALLSDVDTAIQDDMQVDNADQQRHQQRDGQDISKVLGLDLLKDEIDEDAAAVVLADIGLADGDLLDCVIEPDPSLTVAPKQYRTTARDRATDRFGPSRR